MLLTLDRASDASMEALAVELLGPVNAGAGVIWTRPHISLAIAEFLDVEPVIPLLREIATAHAPIQFAMTSMGFFPGAKRVIFLAPVVTPALLDLHRAVDERFARHATRIDGNYRPPKWVPHCTLAMGLTSEQVRPAIDGFASQAMPLEGRFEQLELVEFVPVRVIETFALGV